MKTSRGFSFVELLVVITIIAVLAGVGAVTYTSTMQRSRNAKRIADIQIIRSALEICRSQDGVYPATIYANVTCTGSTSLTATPTDPAGSNYSYSPGAAPITTYTISCPAGETGASCLTPISNP